MRKVILIDTGSGNLRSVQKAFESIGANVLRTNDPRKVQNAGRVVLPGVGAFAEYMNGLQAGGLDDAIKEDAEHGIPLLGICVGMQALFEIGEEMGMHAGLGLLAGRVARFSESLPVKIPHTGWNQVEAAKDAPLFERVNAGAYVYFNHSYYCRPQDSSKIIATTNYGLQFACAVRHENIFGVQFHPEKSQKVGLQILKSFLEVG